MTGQGTSNKRRALKQQDFSKSVLDWFERYGRVFPWRKTSCPYRIFVAEILLRRTQAERVKEAYLGITCQYPTFKALSEANLFELRKWFGQLGLVKRAELMIVAAQIVVRDFAGSLPGTLQSLQQLPGMGEYSARAVACLAFRTRVPMIDESTGRLLRRLLGLKPMRPAYSDTRLLKVAEKMVPVNHARSFNLGLLDIAFKFCHSTNPSCTSCPLTTYCAYSDSLDSCCAR